MFSYFLVPKHVRKAIDVYGAKHRPRSIYGARVILKGGNRYITLLLQDMGLVRCSGLGTGAHWARTTQCSPPICLRNAVHPPNHSTRI